MTGTSKAGCAAEVPATFGHIIERFASYGSRKAVTFYHRNKREELSYGELYEVTRQWMAFLAQQWSLGSGARIVLCSPNDTVVVPISLAVIALGAVLIPLDPDSDLAFLESVLEQAPADAIVLGSDIRQSVHHYLASKAPRYAVLEGVEPPASFVIEGNVHRPAPDMSLLLFTSGTTGRPKGVVLNQSALIANATSLIKNFGLKGITQFAVMPLFHAHAFGFGLMTALLSGGHLVIGRGVDPSLWKRAIREQEVTYTSLVPPLLQMLLRMRVTQDAVPSLRGILVSSAPLTVALSFEFTKFCGIRLIHGWGLSEYTNFACCMRVDEADEYYRNCLLAHQWPAIGHALNGVKLQIRDGAGIELPPGKVGEFWVKGPSLMREYYRDREATREAICDGWLRTGDLGYRIASPQGMLYFVTGRLKEIIIRSGEKIAPLAVEALLRDVLPNWQGGQFAVVGYENNVYGEEVGLYVCQELKMEQDDFMNAMNELPSNRRPKVVILGSEAIPATHTGKVQRRKLQTYFNEYRDYNGPVLLVDRRVQGVDRGEAACRMN